MKATVVRYEAKADRCDVAPVAMGATIVGGYR